MSVVRQSSYIRAGVLRSIWSMVTATDSVAVMTGLCSSLALAVVLCGFFITASRGVLMACGVPAPGGGAAAWPVVLSRSGSTATGLRAQEQARCLRRRLRGERPRSEGWPGHCPARVLLVVPAPDPSSRRRLTESRRSDGIKSDHLRCWSRSVRLDTICPSRLAAPADATRDPGPT